MEKKLKIGLFIDVFFPMVDGVVMVVDNYARRLAEFADVTVFAPRGRDKKHVDDLPYKVVRIKSMKVFFLDYDISLPGSDRKFKKLLKESDFDIIHIHSPFAIGKAGAKFAKKHNIPLVSTMHSQFKKDFKKHAKFNFIANILLKNIMKVFNMCDECWAVNSEIAKIFVEYGAREMPKVQNNGTDMELLKNEQGLAQLVKKHGIKKDEKVFLFVGRIDSLKNIYFTLDALKELKQKSFKFKMLFIGTGIDEEDFKATIKKENMENECLMLGKISDRNMLAKYYNLADLFLFPSMYDASSLVQIEAASQKTPTLFLKGSATSATVSENVDGFLSENSSSKYAAKIIEIFNNEELYKKVAEGAYNDLYVSWDVAVKRAYVDYLRLIAEKKNEKKD